MEMESSLKHNVKEDLNKFTGLVDTFIGLTKNVCYLVRIFSIMIIFFFKYK